MGPGGGTLTFDHKNPAHRVAVTATFWSVGGSGRVRVHLIIAAIKWLPDRVIRFCRRLAVDGSRRVAPYDVAADTAFTHGNLAIAHRGEQ